MLADEAAAYFLSNPLVHQKLHASLQAWLRSLFGAAVHHDYEAAVAFQQRVGQLHAVRDATRAIAYLLDILCEKANHLESGRDTLTHLLNRKFLYVVMSKEVAHARKTGSPLAVLMVDIDHFKNVNDEHGHDAGDFVL